MRRCLLKGLAGDVINAVLAVAGSNLLKLLLRLFLTLIFRFSTAAIWVFSAIGVLMNRPAPARSCDKRLLAIAF